MYQNINKLVYQSPPKKINRLAFAFPKVMAYQTINKSISEGKLKVQCINKPLSGFQYTSHTVISIFIE